MKTSNNKHIVQIILPCINVCTGLPAENRFSPLSKIRGTRIWPTLELGWCYTEVRAHHFAEVDSLTHLLTRFWPYLPQKRSDFQNLKRTWKPTPLIPPSATEHARRAILPSARRAPTEQFPPSARRATHRASHRALAKQPTEQFLPSARRASHRAFHRALAEHPPSTFWGIPNFAQGGLKHTKKMRSPNVPKN